MWIKLLNRALIGYGYVSEGEFRTERRAAMREGRLNVRDIVGRPNTEAIREIRRNVGEIRSDLVVNLFVVSPTSYTKIPRF